MFTGIVEELGQVHGRSSGASSVRLEIGAAVVLDDLGLGSSIAVNGVCLTVVDVTSDGFAADVVAETLHRSTLGRLEVGDHVNLERPLRADGRFGGHIVQGHVDATVELLAMAEDADGGAEIELEVPAALRPMILEKGSVALDGVSLTVAQVLPGRMRIALIPHTRSVTTFGAKQPGERCNVEVDYVAKVVANLGQTAVTAAPAAVGVR